MKKIFFLVLTFVIVTICCGCSKTEEITHRELVDLTEVLTDYLSTTAYIPPENYSIRDIGLITVSNDNNSVSFNNQKQIISCNLVDKAQLKKFTEIATQFTTNIRYDIPASYKVSYYNNNQNLLCVEHEYEINLTNANLSIVYSLPDLQVYTVIRVISEKYLFLLLLLLLLFISLVLNT